MDAEETADAQWRKYPRKPVTFASSEQMKRATDYCKRRGIGFSELVRKLLADHMRSEEVPTPEGAGIRIIKEPSR